MKEGLNAYFPLIRERDDILLEIRSKKDLSKQFYSWSEERQTEFLNFCTGVKGVKVLYDAFFKEIMNPETDPALLEEFLSLILGKMVRIICVLPNDSTRIADESSLLITDLVVQLEDGSLANVEVQRIGYLFPGERCACYSADLLLRQYKRIRSSRKKKFSYKDIKSVYTIILFEKSPEVFHEFPDIFLHRFEQQSDSGIRLELLQKYLFLPLDIFQRKMHNEPVRNKLEAWLMFFSTDDPSNIIRLIDAYPEFKPLYELIYRICRNMEKIMGIFSEELLWLDRNTTQYMIDEMQDTIDEMKGTIDGMKGTIEEQQKQLEEERQKAYKSNLIALIRQVRNLTAKGISPEECSSLLDADVHLVLNIYELLQKYPNAKESDIYNHLGNEMPS